MTVKFQLAAGRWAGWLEAPAKASFGATGPISLTAVSPLKTGQGDLRLSFLQPFAPRQGCRREVDLRVVQHGTKHLVGVFNENGTQRTAIVADPTRGWLENYCSGLMTKRLPEYWQTVETPAETSDFFSYLTATFGLTEAEVLSGANRSSFDLDLKPMPKRRTTFPLDVEYEPVDSLLISRGRVPHQMEDKWFILMEEERLRFYRSWTGLLIYDVEATWLGDRLHLGQVTANRKKSEYSETDQTSDKALLNLIIDTVLRGSLL